MTHYMPDKYWDHHSKPKILYKLCSLHSWTKCAAALGFVVISLAKNLRPHCWRIKERDRKDAVEKNNKYTRDPEWRRSTRVAGNFDAAKYKIGNKTEKMTREK